MVIVKKSVGKPFAVRSFGQIACYTGIIPVKEGHPMEKLTILFESIRYLCEKDINRIIDFIMNILAAATPAEDRPACPRCGSAAIIKYGHTSTGKQRFLCKSCGETYLHTTNTMLACSHQSRTVWMDFIRDTISGVSLDKSAVTYDFSHQTAFNMRHKILMALEDWQEQNPDVLSEVAELDETFVLESYKGKKLPENFGRGPRKHGAKASSPGISNEFIAICSGVQRGNGAVVVKSVNRAKPSKGELSQVFSGHIADGSLVLTDGLRGYSVINTLADCEVKDVNLERQKTVFNLNTVNSLHSYIKSTYEHYRGVATKYLNRYNALFAVTFRGMSGLAESLFQLLSNTSQRNYWHSCQELREDRLLAI